MKNRDRSAVRGLALACALSLAACADSAEAPGASSPNAGLPQGHPPIQPGSQVSIPSDAPVGMVLETMDAGGYTYARIESRGEEIWAAGPPTPLSVGDSILLAGGTEMTDFTSSTLARTFESILFLDAFLTPAPSTAAAGMRGRVLESMNVGDYTYVHVEVEDGTIWVAGPVTAVSEGQTVAWIGGVLMRNFESRALGRTFDAILFAGALSVVE